MANHDNQRSICICIYSIYHRLKFSRCPWSVACRPKTITFFTFICNLFMIWRLVKMYHYLPISCGFTKMMKNLFTCLFCLTCLGLIYSCQKGGIPFYMSMNRAHVNTTSSDITAGDTTNAITDAWVQTTSTNLGAYQMPCNFPVLDQYNVHFLVNAGVWESGQQEVRVPYPFYTTDTFTVQNAQATHQYTHTTQAFLICQPAH
jgi:hypothetical protein